MAADSAARLSIGNVQPEAPGRAQTPALPMVLEDGLEPAVLAFAVAPVSTGVAALAQDVRDAFFGNAKR